MKIIEIWVLVGFTVGNLIMGGCSNGGSLDTAHPPPLPGQDAARDALSSRKPSGHQFENPKDGWVDSETDSTPDSALTADGSSSPPPPPVQHCVNHAFFNNKECDNCAKNNCTTLCNACSNDANCTGLLTCLSACGDDDCRNACKQNHPQGNALISALFMHGMSCVRQKCAVQCTGQAKPGCADFGGVGVCNKCAATNCTSQCDACIASLLCTYYWACIGGCGTNMICRNECETRFSGGKALYNNLMNNAGSCRSNVCRSECGRCGNFQNPQCGECVMTHCKGECVACLMDTDLCKKFKLCADECRLMGGNDTFCWVKCQTESGNGAQLWVPWAKCLSKSCSHVCNKSITVSKSDENIFNTPFPLLSW